jgi:hypothetical protein
LKAPSISNYRWDPKKSSALTGTYQATNREILLYYHKKTSAIIRLVDVENKKILHTQIMPGYSGDVFRYDLPRFQNYQTPPNPSVVGKLTNAQQVIQVPYVHAIGDLTIRYINAQTGNPLLPSEQISSELGTWQVVRRPFIPNYTYVNTGNEVGFQQQLTNQTRTLYYDPNLETIKVDYVDIHGHMLAPSSVFVGYYGSSRAIKAKPIQGYQVASGTLSSYKVAYNQPYQQIVIKYQPIKETVTFRFVDDTGRQMYQPVTITGDYGSIYDYKPHVPWYAQLTDVSQKEIKGKYTKPKEEILIRYTRRQAQIHVIAKDEWGHELKRYTISGYESHAYRTTPPQWWWLSLSNPSQQVLHGTYRRPNQTITVIYKHIPAQLTVIGMDDRGNIVTHIPPLHGYEGSSYGVILPGFWYLKLDPANSYRFTGIYRQRQTTLYVLYHHIPATQTLR